MILIDFSLLLISAFLWLQTFKFRLIIPFVLGFFPFSQIVLIFYLFHFNYELIIEKFIHYYLWSSPTLIIFQYSIYLLILFLVGFYFNISIKAKFSFNPFRNEFNLKYLTFDLNKLLIIYSIVILLFLLSTSQDILMSKLLRLLFYNLSYIPIVVGLFIIKIRRKILIICLFSFSFFSVISIVTGSRGYAVIPIFLFILGFYLNNDNSRYLKKFSFFLVLFSFIVFPFMSFIEIYRGLSGRIQFNEFTIERVSDLFSQYQNLREIDSDNSDGIARLVNWPSISVSLLINQNYVNTRSFDFILSDLNYLVDNTFINKSTVEFARDKYINNLWGTGPANLFDYNVTLTNSVEFSVFADGIWRYGSFGFIISIFLLAIIFIFIEFSILYSFKRKGCINLFKFCLYFYLLYLSFSFVSAEPLFSCIRALIYNIISLFFFSIIFKFLFKYLRFN